MFGRFFSGVSSAPAPEDPDFPSAEDPPRGQGTGRHPRRGSGLPQLGIHPDDTNEVISWLSGLADDAVATVLTKYRLRSDDDPAARRWRLLRYHQRTRNQDVTWDPEEDELPRPEVELPRYDDAFPRPETGPARRANPAGSSQEQGEEPRVAPRPPLAAPPAAPGRLTPPPHPSSVPAPSATWVSTPRRSADVPAPSYEPSGPSYGMVRSRVRFQEELDQDGERGFRPAYPTDSRRPPASSTSLPSATEYLPYPYPEDVIPPPHEFAPTRYEPPTPSRAAYSMPPHPYPPQPISYPPTPAPHSAPLAPYPTYSTPYPPSYLPGASYRPPEPSTFAPYPPEPPSFTPYHRDPTPYPLWVPPRTPDLPPRREPAIYPPSGYQTGSRYETPRPLAAASLPYSGYSSERPRDTHEVVRKWGLKFAGKGETSPEEFLRRVDECRAGSRLSDRDVLGALPFLLTGIALQWYRLENQRWLYWSDFAHAFRNRFGSVNYEIRVRDEARRRTQGPNEPIADYLVCLRMILHSLPHPWPDHEQLDLAYTNLHPQYRHAIARSQFDSFETLEYAGRRVEASRALDRYYVPPPTPESALLPEFACQAPPPKTAPAPKAGNAAPTAAIDKAEAKPRPRNREKKGKPPAKSGPPPLMATPVPAPDFPAPTGGSNSRRSPAPPATNAATPGTPGGCFRCHSTGHFVRECPQPASYTACSRCRTPGVTDATCSRCAGTAPGNDPRNC